MFNQNSISVIITTYNSSTYFEKAIESVLNQSIKVETIIIVDDCSEDFKNLKEKLSKIVFNNKNTNFELIHNKKTEVLAIQETQDGIESKQSLSLF